MVGVPHRPLLPSLPTLQVNKDGARVISMREVEQHSSEDDAWIVVRGKVCLHPNPETRNLKPETRTPKIFTRNPQP